MSKYKGLFNISGQCIEIYTNCCNDKAAYNNFIYQISKKYDISINKLLRLFNGNKDNFNILKV